jgi:hypothetical protein
VLHQWLLSLARILYLHTELPDVQVHEFAATRKADRGIVAASGELTEQIGLSVKRHLQMRVNCVFALHAERTDTHAP